MGIFNVILGIFAILGSVYCLFFPGLTFLSSGWIISILLGVWGICAIFNYIAIRKNGGKTNKDTTIMGTICLIAGIISSVFSVIALFSPSLRGVIDLCIIYIFIGWLVIKGINDVAFSIAFRKQHPLWILSLILGIITALAGLYGVFHVVFIGQMIGVLIGILLMIYGIKLVASGFGTGE